jgi:hypothetical protein
MPSNVIRTNRPTVFTTNLKAVTLSNRYDGVTIQNQQESNISNSESFRYDQIGAALKSTQEIPLDYSKFENHTFYNSAVAKVNVGFDQIINNYPFDSSITEIENFEDNLTGYERYLLSLFSKNKNFLLFNGSSYITVTDAAGINFPTISKDDSGSGILDPNDNNFSFEIFCYPSAEENDNQIILQKRKDQQNAITIALSQSVSTTECKAIFAISNGSLYATASSNIEKGKFSHLYCEYLAEDATGSLKIYTNLERTSTEQDSLNFGNIAFNNAALTIGSGSSHTLGAYTFTPQMALTGALDEIRFYHNIVDKNDLSYNWKKEVYAKPDLKLYFKFNEPTGSYGANNVVLDYSGNSLHSYVQNFTTSLREGAGIKNPMSAENIERCPVLFSDYPATVQLNQTILVDASLYDNDNPNLITKIVPAHYLRDGYISQGFVDEDGTIGDNLSGASMPGTSVIGSPQIITAVLLVYAKFFDELKIFVDHFANLVHVDYDQNESITDKFLPFLANYYGFEVPSLFKTALSDQFYDGRNVTENDEKLAQNLDFVRKQLWRRMLVNMSSIMREKGTNSSVRSLFHAAGIIPENFFTIREFGGPKKSFLDGRRETKTEVSTMLDFSGSLSLSSGINNAQGFSSKKPYITGSYLSGSRVEPGYPNVSGTASDGLFTSGSFTLEGTYKFSPGQVSYHSESLIRLHVTGNLSPATTHGVIMNVVATSGSTLEEKSLTLYARPNMGVGVETLSLKLTGVDIFDGDKWKISAGRYRNDEIGVLSSSYFLRAGKNIDSDTYVTFLTSSYFYDAHVPSTTAFNAFQTIDTRYNTSGAFIVIGSQSLASSPIYLNDSTDTSKTTNFSGKVAQLRMWSKSQSETEFIEHVRNYKSLGIDKPLINYSFDLETTGTFERMRFDLSTDQIVTSSNASGQIQLFDFSQNNLFAQGESFESLARVIKPETFYYSHLAPNFDQSTTTNKVRVRSLQNPEESTITTARLAPVYDVIRSEESEDDRRFLIEYSVVKAMNEDIIRLLSDLDFFDNALGKPSYMYDDYYPDIEQMRKIYFNRLTDKLNYKIFFDLFKWFDASYTDLITSLMPKKTQFLGINYTIESHMLERHRMRYLYDQQYTLGTVAVQNETGVGFETGIIT